MGIEPHTEEARKLLNKALKAYQKKSKEYARLCKAKRKYQKRNKDKKLNKINDKIQAVEIELITCRITLDKAKERLKGRSYSYTLTTRK